MFFQKLAFNSTHTYPSTLETALSVNLLLLFSHSAASDSLWPKNCSLPGSSVHGIPQTRIQDWVAISFSMGSSQARDQTCISCLGRQILYYWTTWVQGPFRSDQISRSVVSDSLRPHESQHARPPCPSPTPRVHWDSHPSSQRCHPAISSSVVPFSSCPQSLPVSGSFPMSQLFAWGGQSTGVSALASFLPKKSQGWSPSEWTGWISLQSITLLQINVFYLYFYLAKP